ncbi:hypothetical protein [Polaromonas sp.]|uniref:hypothetical protein n=1 Tax=Polaromonas sp. TaxID=1869339 RepID=UPI003266353C
MNNTPITAQQRLANSRQAIIRQMGLEAPEDDGFMDGSPTGSATYAEENSIDTSAGTWSLMKQVAGAWWHGHPARLAVDFAKPVFQTFAEQQPMRLLGISAGIGAAAVVLRPWRLISVTGLLLAALKSSEINGAVHSMLSPRRKRHPYP